jgi:serine/threonine protein kinase
MELVDGKPLRDVIEKGGMPRDALLRTGIAMTDAVAAAHQRGIVHRDLKPANVMVGADGRVKVLDFGLAKIHDAEAASAGEEPTHLPTNDLTGEGRIVGTVAYMSPEQAEGKSVDQRSDIFSLGVMLHEMATGERPFKGDTGVSIISSIIKDTPASVTDSRPELPPQLARIIKRCLVKDPQRRYQTARDLHTDLEDLKQDIDSGVLSSPSGAAEQRRRRARISSAEACRVRSCRVPRRGWAGRRLVDDWQTPGRAARIRSGQLRAEDRLGDRVFVGGVARRPLRRVRTEERR